MKSETFDEIQFKAKACTHWVLSSVNGPKAYSNSWNQCFCVFRGRRWPLAVEK